jgi:hypothetical protein
MDGYGGGQDQGQSAQPDGRGLAPVTPGGDVEHVLAGPERGVQAGVKGQDGESGQKRQGSAPGQIAAEPTQQHIKKKGEDYQRAVDAHQEREAEGNSPERSGGHGALPREGSGAVR